MTRTKKHLDLSRSQGRGSSSYVKVCEYKHTYVGDDHKGYVGLRTRKRFRQ